MQPSTTTDNTSSNSDLQNQSKTQSDNQEQHKDLFGENSSSDEKKMTENTIIRCKLPDFDTENLELWFATAEIIFDENGINTEKKKFSVLLQHLDKSKRANLQTIVLDTTEAAPYTKAKQTLTSLYGITDEKKLDQILSGVEIQNETRPLLILQEIRRLSGEWIFPNRS